VTLQGDKADWKNILDRLGKFAEYGDELEASARLLEAIVKRFVATFGRPEEERELREFWMEAVHAEGKFGSGPSPTFDV
jgi:hypothetical protein